MRRVSRSAGLAAELFPFLAVLACIIGTLVLLVIVVTTSVLGEKRSITLVARDAAGKSVTLKPHIIECRKDGIVLHPAKEFVPSSQVSRTDTPLRALLNEVSAHKDTDYIIVAVRPDGMDLFEKVRSLVENRGIQIGYEPIDADWNVKARL